MPRIRVFHLFTTASAMLWVSITVSCIPATNASPDTIETDNVSNVTEPTIPFEIIRVNTKQELIDIYCNSMRYYYHGSDELYHYLINNFHDEIVYVNRSIVSDQDMKDVYKLKITRDRSAIPHYPGDKRSKEFFDWRDSLKVNRIQDIDIDQDW